MSSIAGHCRTQRLLLPDLLDDDVTDATPVRFMDAYVERLDLASLGVARAQAALTGRPADAPRDLLQLDLSGDLNRLRARRRRERATPRHVELLWRLRKLRPDCATLAACSKQNTNALQALCRAFVLRCRPLNLLGADLLAIDGRTCKAGHNQHKHVPQATLEKARKDIDAKVEPYLRDLDPSDQEESRVQQPTRAALQEELERRQERQKRYRGFGQEITASGEPQRSLPDPARRSRPQSPKGAVGYHGQMAVDSQPTRMVAQEVTKASTADEQLRPMAMRAQETRGVDQMRAVADLGDEHGHESNAGDEAGMDADVPKPSPSAPTTLGRLGKERFTDAPQKDCYRCPAGEERTVRCETTALGRHSRDEATGACRRCPMQAQCTSNNDGRRMTRWVDEHSLECREERRKAHPTIRQER
jgi:transposase